MGLSQKAKISAVHSLADICFLHAPIRLIRYIIVSVCVQVFKRVDVFCIRLYKCLVRSYSSVGSVNAYYPQFRFCFILLFIIFFVLIFYGAGRSAT